MASLCSCLPIWPMLPLVETCRNLDGTGLGTCGLQVSTPDVTEEIIEGQVCVFQGGIGRCASSKWGRKPRTRVTWGLRHGRFNTRKRHWECSVRWRKDSPGNSCASGLEMSHAPLEQGGSGSRREVSQEEGAGTNLWGLRMHWEIYSVRELGGN